MHLNLIVSGVGVHKGVDHGPHHIHHLVNPWQRKVVFGASLVEIGEINADPPLGNILLHQDRIGEPFEMVRLMWDEEKFRACGGNLMELGKNSRIKDWV